MKLRDLGLVLVASCLMGPVYGDRIESKPAMPLDFKQTLSDVKKDIGVYALNDFYITQGDYDGFVRGDRDSKKNLSNKLKVILENGSPEEIVNQLDERDRRDYREFSDLFNSKDVFARILASDREREIDKIMNSFAKGGVYIPLRPLAYGPDKKIIFDYRDLSENKKLALWFLYKRHVNFKSENEN